MKQKMTWEGIGVKIAVFSLPYFILTIVLMIFRPEFLQMKFLPRLAAWIAGGVVTLAGLDMLGHSVQGLIDGIRKQKMVTTGIYGLSRNPLYASWIFLIVPGLAVLFRSWLLLAGSVVVYVNFKLLIHEEYRVLKANFGKKYEQYAARVNEMLPLPKTGILEKILDKKALKKKKKK
jgi:protein-S-isoprenylcysteine O-methyltransferase Ste14